MEEVAAPTDDAKALDLPIRWAVSSRKWKEEQETPASRDSKGVERGNCEEGFVQEKG